MSENNKEKIAFVGVDDGFRETKVWVSDDVKIVIPSQARAGEMTQISIDGGAKTVFPYETKDGAFIVGKIKESDATSNDDYPISAMNRVLVTHALISLGFTGANRLAIATGLPYKRYYRGKDKNLPLIKAKRKNLLLNDVKEVLYAPNGKNLSNLNIPRIVEHHVISEGIAAWMDYVLERDPETGNLTMNKDKSSVPTAFVDIGGRTTDIAVIEDCNIETDKSTTIEAGMLNIENLVKEKISDEYDVIPTTAQMNQVMKTKMFRAWGTDYDVSEFIELAIKQEMAKIHAEVSRRLGSAADLDSVNFVGGTTVAVEHELQGWFRNQNIVKDPGFANARGMAKFIETALKK
ncbi:ParM/StbA family protein [Vibrio parahaemolyticus]|uniref:ParM/StbA family protein n=1 Tax=Vibrio parahaemolyticus TaxID=670 RepID=UPI001A265A82|nr:ParM/StbA family protein [Vibrio parahaemolyticus]EGR3229545.1 hypothetical protein [Vibrio parahaemolyticus]EJG0181566.1 ParM/StbA family protein [Vibrio parahaemolyticus]MCS0114814.1 ParM/StbA family protein [Vibrio parahaemolyticus]